MLLFVLVVVMTVRTHVAIRRMERRRHPALAEERYLSDMPDKPVETPGFDGPRTANAPARTAGADRSETGRHSPPVTVRPSRCQTCIPPR